MHIGSTAGRTSANAVTYAELCQLCDRLTDELQLGVGMAGRVRSMILTNLVRHAKFDSIAEQLKMSRAASGADCKKKALRFGS